MTESKRYVFVVDTDSYAGNFERQMCAFITGQIGECGVGDNYREDADILREDHYDFNISDILKWFEEHVLQVPDEHGCCRPCEIWSTPGRTNLGGTHVDISEEHPMKYPAYESVGIFLDEVPPEDVARFMVIRANMFQMKPCKFGSERKIISVKSCRLVVETTTIVEESTSLDIPLAF